MMHGTLYQARGVLITPSCPWLLPGLGMSAELTVREAQSGVGGDADRPGVAWALRIWQLAGIRTPEQVETVAELVDWADRTERWTPRVPSLGAIACRLLDLVGIVIRLDPLVVVLPDDGILTARRLPPQDAVTGYSHLHPLPRS